MLGRAARSAADPDVSLELAFYRFAHVSDERDAAFGELRRLVADGIRSPEWDLSANVDRATATGHPERDCWPIWASVIADGVPVDTLDRYQAWTTTGLQAGSRWGADGSLGAAEAGPCATDRHPPMCGGAAGSCTVTRSPPAARGVRVRIPSCARLMLSTIARPRPTPACSVRMRSVPR